MNEKESKEFTKKLKKIALEKKLRKAKKNKQEPEKSLAEQINFGGKYRDK